MFDVMTSPGVVNQNVTHHLRRHSKEVRAILPIDFLLPGQTKIRLVHQSGSLQRVANALTLNVTMRNTPQFVIDQGRQTIERSFVALARTRLGEFASAEGGMRDPKDREAELSFWESVRESDNPASLQAYLEKYPDGEFKSLAEIRLSELRVPPISS